MEFPEARIYEETLNCLLYENRIGPDQELMQATSLRAPPGPSYTSDDEDDRTGYRGPGSGGPGAANSGQGRPSFYLESDTLNYSLKNIPNFHLKPGFFSPVFEEDQQMNFPEP